MRSFGSRVLLAAGPALLIAATATGCTPAADSRASSSPAASASPTPSASASSAAGGGKAAGSTAKPAKKTASCGSGDVTVAVTAQNPLSTGSTVRAMITVTNTSSHTCRVNGWTTVTLLNAAGEAAPLKISKVEQPGPAEPIDLKPGTSALAGLKWTQCDKGDETCPVGNSVEVAVPGAKSASPTTLEAFPAPEKSNIAMAAAQLGPLQGSRQGVVAW
ncbi:MAG TPA: DUF4232 domain-containing protein [Actinoplanes sp.]|nr:DUF4232 domain-containing protein [Actinoplanes sp.]